MWRRNPDTQLALLDRLAGTSAAVGQYTEKLEQLRVAHAQLAAIDALGNEEQRERLQALVDQVRLLLCSLGRSESDFQIADAVLTALKDMQGYMKV